MYGGVCVCLNMCSWTADGKLSVSRCESNRGTLQRTQAVDPSKIDNIPRLLEKYKGRERRLFMKIMDKYPEDPECHILTSPGA